MCGIFGIVSDHRIEARDVRSLARHSRQRGRDSSGLVFQNSDKTRLKVTKADYDLLKLLKNVRLGQTHFVLGHSRLITNGLLDNQPIVRDGTVVIHNGIVTNQDEIWETLPLERQFEVDSEVINALAIQHLTDGQPVETIADAVLSRCKGTIAAALMLPELGKIVLFSNNGSLYVARNGADSYFASEKYPLTQLGLDGIEQVTDEPVILEIPVLKEMDVKNHGKSRLDLIPEFKVNDAEARLLEYEKPDLKRCTKCILPETMPFIRFDDEGVCNYCNNYKIRNTPKPKEELLTLVEKYRREHGPECIVPFSGGRDSCYALHLIIKELDMVPITYTYDWGMVTDLGRRNISRMCSELGVENIIVADNISLKRANIVKNLNAWLKNPHLGMISILTAGDKHFFRYVETIKKQTGISLNLWGVNPLELTHFKAGFLGVPPDFEEHRVYMSSFSKQMEYQRLRLKAMMQSSGYFNASLWDTLSGEYYRSFNKKTDYFHVFDYWRWDERLVDQVLASYDWELAPDTKTTWRIGDGTAAFYNYIYYTVAGFTEHDTFRSNQIREGQMSRPNALALVEEENLPRYQNIRWYLDTLGMDFASTISRINQIPKLYR